MGQVLILRPGAWHVFTHCRDLVVANCCISARGLRTELSALQQLPILRDLLWTTPISGLHGVATTEVTPPAAADAIDQIAQLARDLDERSATSSGRGKASSPGRREATSSGRGEAIAGRLLGRLVTVLGILADGRVDRSSDLTPALHPAVATTVARFESDLAEPWRLDDLATAANLDPAYLSRLFRRDTGLSPLNYLARLRAERAALLLTESTLPAARVGAAVGWPDPTYFARRFRELVGMTPSQYRKRTRR